MKLVWPRVTKARLRLAGLASLALWLLAFPLPAYFTSEAGLVYEGYEVAFAGIFGPLTLQFGWFANWLWLYAVISLLLGQMPGAVACVIIAIVGADAFLVSEMWGSNEGYSVKAWPGPAAYLWYAALIIPGLCVLVGKRNERAARHADVQQS